MHITLIIPTIGRPEVVAQLLSHLERQTLHPDHVIVSTTSSSDIGGCADRSFKLSCIYGPPGLCAQRNRALDICSSKTDIICFFDDDFIPDDNYIETLSNIFSDHPEYSVVMGNILADGINGPGLTFEQAMSVLNEHRPDLKGAPRVEDHPGAYGCNMSIRAGVIGNLRFDERLPLYGWQEDIDFTSQLRAFGRIVFVENLFGVHLGTKSGRVSGVRLGYSQIVNPVYLIGKGTMPFSFGFRLMCRNLAANIIKSFEPEPYVDRRGRLKGNMIAISHLFMRRADPEYILKL